MRGRVIAIDRGDREGDRDAGRVFALVRTERVDERVVDPPAAWRVGEFVDLASGSQLAPERVPTAPYPGPGSEVMRLSRGRLAKLHARARALATVGLVRDDNLMDQRFVVIAGKERIGRHDRRGFLAIATH